MDRRVGQIIALLSISVLSLSLRVEFLYGIVPSAATLLSLAIVTRSKIAAAGICVGGILWYPAAQAGWLWGRDSHRAAYLSSKLLESRWPFDAQEIRSVGGSPDTPLVHFLGKITAEVTGLGILPNADSQFLATAILPMIFVGVTYLIILCIVHQYVSDIGHSTVTLAFLPAVIWLHIYYVRVGFRRPSIAIVIFAMAILALYQFSHHLRNEWFAVLTLALVSLPVAHNFASALLLLLLVSAGIVLMPLQTSEFDRWMKQPRVNDILIIAAIGLLFFGTWSVLTSRDSEGLVLLAFQVLSVGESVTVIPGSVDVTFTDLFVRVYSKVIYAGLLALPILGYAVLRWRSRELRYWDVLIILWGAITASFAAASIFTSFDLASGRAISYFIVFGSGMSIPAIGYLFSTSRIRARHIQVGFLTCLIILSGIAVPLSTISDAEPDLSQQPYDQRYGQSLYATAEFTSYVPSDTKVVGDSDAAEVTSPLIDRELQYALTPYRNGTVDEGSAVIHRDFNERYFIGRIAGGVRTLSIETEGRSGLEATADKIYANGDERIYMKSLSN